MTRREIARDYRLAELVTDTSAIRSLRTKQALSDGLAIEMRGAGGRLGGRMHLYSALNRDAARALRRDDPRLAVRFARAASALERSREARRVANALTNAGVIENASALARALSAPAIAQDVAALQRKQVEARIRIADVKNFTVLLGHISGLHDNLATLCVPHHASLTVPRSVADDAGVGAVGAAVSAMWEVLPGGRTMITLEPAVDSPDMTSSGEPLVDVYGTAWGRILSEADAETLKLMGAPTIAIPDGIPDVP